MPPAPAPPRRERGERRRQRRGRAWGHRTTAGRRSGRPRRAWHGPVTESCHSSAR
jgi:hypothetical protein